MGGWYFDKKDTVEDCRSVSIAFLRKHGFLCGYRSGVISWKNWHGEQTDSIGVTVSTGDGEDCVRFCYTSTDRRTGEKAKYDYKVWLATTPCNLGGARWWFTCPLTKDGVYCGRRVGRLYLPPRGEYFGCRHCYDLSYESRNECRYGRVAHLGRHLALDRRIEQLREQVRRWTYSGVPTRKARRVYALEARRIAHFETHLANLWAEPGRGVVIAGPSIPGRLSPNDLEQAAQMSGAADFGARPMRVENRHPARRPGRWRERKRDYGP